MTETSDLTLDQVNIADPARYEREGYPWQDWDVLRREAPVYFYNRPGTRPFWAVTRYNDILAISRNPRVFRNTENFILMTEEEEAITDAVYGGSHTRDLLDTDPPEHGIYRNAVNRPFTSRALRLIEPRIQELSQGIIESVVRRLVDPLEGAGRADFVTDFSVKLPVYVICEMLGVAPGDYDDVLLWSNEGIAPIDPEFRNGRSAEETAAHSFEGMSSYFEGLIEKRKRTPGNDVVSVLVQARVDGEPLPHGVILGICNLLLIAGNETTRNATSGGMLALLQHPAEFAKLRADPSLLDSAIEEMLRWTSPVIQFLRHLAEDVELGGQRIRAGERLALWYPSANRDESVFPDPYHFDITRSPNDHLAFGGFGEHYCLGANLARLELRVAFRQILARLPEIEIDGPVQRTRSMLVGGVNHMPVRFKA